MKSSKNTDGNIIFDEELNRAAQFMPFDALKGLTEELRKREERHCRVEKTELSEEESALVNNELCKLQAGNAVRIRFYYKGHYITLDGTLNKLVPQMRYLTIGATKIGFDDIYDIKQIDASDLDEI